MGRLQGYSLSEIFAVNTLSASGLDEKWNRLTIQDISFFQISGIPKSFKKGSLVLRQDTRVRGIYLLLDGKIKVSQELASGQIQIFHFHRQGDLLGCHHLINDECYNFQATAIEDCQTIFLSSDQFLAQLEKSQTFMHYVLWQQSREFALWTHNYTFVARQAVKTRLATCLLKLNDVYKIPENPTTVIHISRTDLANYAATSLETTVRTLREMKDAGFIHLRGRRIIILDFKALALISREQKPAKN